MDDPQNLFGQIVVGAGLQSPEPPTATAYRYAPGDVSGVATIGRRWDSAETNRLNAAHWLNVSAADDINDDLQSDLQVIQRRARHESINNGMVEGAIETHSTDVVGRETPGLQLLTDNQAFNDAAEQLWTEWAESCEHQHGLAMADLLHGFVGQWWINGEFLIQEIIGRRAIDYRLHDIGAELIDVTMHAANIVLGVELDESKRVIAYHITDPDSPGKRTRLRGDFAIHAFRRRFSGQLRGIPILEATYKQPPICAITTTKFWMPPDRPPIKRYGWSPIIPTPNFVNVAPGTTTEVKRRVWRHAAPGWRPFQMDAKQPLVQYTDYRKERQREIAGPLKCRC